MATQQKVLDLDLNSIQKTKIRINGDQSRFIELNLSDMNIVKRLETAYENLQKLAEEVATLSDKFDIDVDDTENAEKAMKQLSEALTELDRKMRDEIDYLFDSKVSDVCVPSGTMYDPHNGMFMFEHIISALASYYTTNFQEEFEAMRNNVDKHTKKYTKKPQDHKGKQK